MVVILALASSTPTTRSSKLASTSALSPVILATFAVTGHAFPAPSLTVHFSVAPTFHSSDPGQDEFAGASAAFRWNRSATAARVSLSSTPPCPDPDEHAAATKTGSRSSKRRITEPFELRDGQHPHHRAEKHYHGIPRIGHTNRQNPRPTP